MRKRHKSRGGQALVMITVALIAMAGMMGLAVDLGWSFFVQKQAQAAADAGALAAATRAYYALSTAGLVATAWGGCGTSNVSCAASPVRCNTLSSGNLYEGCQYAASNGFTDGANNQIVTIQANKKSVALPTAIPTPPGPPVDMVYWVTVGTVQTIPQLFSAVLGHTQGTVTAVATAAIASSIFNGSFWGMNKAGDCAFDTYSSGVATYINCGVDVNVAGPSAACPGAAYSAFLCAPAGLILSSICAGTAQAGCGAGANGALAGTNYGGNNGKVYAPTISLAASGDDGHLTEVGSPQKSISSGSSYPFDKMSQPPLSVPTDSSGNAQAIGSCGYPGGVIPSSGSGTTLIGPYQYYSYTVVNNVKIPDGKPIVPPSNATFSPTASCPSSSNMVYTAGASQTSTFPAYIFYGGLALGSATVNFGAGQYVLAGTNGSNSIPGGINGGDNVLTAKNGTLETASGNTTGSMVITTDAYYPGLSSQWANIPNASNASSAIPTLTQGSLDLKNTNIGASASSPMLGFDKANLSTDLPSLDPYTGVFLWQDRRNSTDIYNQDPSKTVTTACTLCTKDDGTVEYCYINCASAPSASMYTENHVTATSPSLAMQDGNGTVYIKGALYQPRGAWFDMSPGTAAISNSPLQILTGQIVCGKNGSGCGNVSVTLLGPTNQLIAYKPVLIQ